MNILRTIKIVELNDGFKSMLDEKEKFILALFNDLKEKHIKDEILLISNNNHVRFRYVLKTNELWYSYTEGYITLYDKFGYSHEDIKPILIKLFQQYLHIEVKEVWFEL